MRDIIYNHFTTLNLDIRKSRNGRFMDQKLTHDNLSFICDSILNFLGSETNKEFRTRDIWKSEYFRKNIMFVYNKPDPKDQRAGSEYDKFIIQPLRLLTNAGVLSDYKDGAAYVYKVRNMELLTYIALNGINALHFLDGYLTKVLKDSGEIVHFDSYRDAYRNGTFTNENLVNLRDRYIRFIIGNTDINGEVEVRRIFNKVLNILAVSRRMPGVKQGKVTTYPVIFKDLEYNQVNWRDLKKRKNLTRSEAEKLEEIQESKDRITDYEMSKTKAAIKKRHSLLSEVNDSLASGVATQVHHIFPDSGFPDYRATPENLILLTAGQHNTRAHPNNNHHLVDGEYQRICLLAKLESIDNSIRNSDGFYSLEVFVDMINDIKKLNIPKGAAVNMVRDRLTQY